MGAYILRRLLLVLPTLFGIMVLNFVLIQFVPGGPIEQIIAELEGGGDVFESISGGGSEIAEGAGSSDYVGAQGLPPDFIEELEREFGFDKPPLERFLNMMWNYMRFDFGESYFRKITVVDLVLEKMPVSITLGLWSTLIAYLVSIPLGIRKAVRDGTPFDTWTSGAIIVGYAIPGFLFAILLIVVFAGGSYLQWFPLRGLTSDEFETMTLTGRFGSYAPYVVLAIAASVAGSVLAHRRAPDMNRRAEAGAVFLGSIVGVAAAGAVIAAISGDTLGAGREHLWIVLLPAGFAALTAALWAWRTQRDDIPARPGGAALRVGLAGLPGIFAAILLIGILSISGQIPQVPPGAEVPAGITPTLFGKIGDYFWHIWLPVIASTIGAFATLTLLTKNSFLDEIKKQYVMTAKAKGLSERRVLYGHVFRNAMLIVISGFPALFIGVFFGGSLIIETLFSLDGLGRLGFEAAVARDYPVVFGTLFTFSLIGLVVGIITDLTYVLIDPRIDFESRG